MATAKFDGQHARRVPRYKGTCLRHAHKRVFDIAYLGLDQAAQRTVDLMRKHGITADDLVPLCNAKR